MARPRCGLDNKSATIGVAFKARPRVVPAAHRREPSTTPQVQAHMDMSIGSSIGSEASGWSIMLRVVFGLNLIGVACASILLVRREAIGPVSRWLGRLFLGAHAASVALGLVSFHGVVHQVITSVLGLLAITLVPGVLGGVAWVFLLFGPAREEAPPSLFS
jgi:hypothetical protein